MVDSFEGGNEAKGSNPCKQKAELQEERKESTYARNHSAATPNA
jgi:hypothetical protein